MKKIIGFCCLALSMVSTSAMAVELSTLNATTFAEAEKVSTPGFDKKTEARFIQYVDLNAAKLGVDNLSLDAYGWGRWGVNTGTATGDLSSGYIMYRTPKSNGYVKLGRFYDFNVTGVNQLDGLGLGADLGAGLRLTGFAGKPVEVSELRGRAVYGGTLSFKVPKYIDLGASAVREDGLPTYNANGSIRKDFQELVGIKGWASPHKIVELSGDATYNTVTSGWGEQRYNILVRTTDYLTLNGEYQQYRLNDYFATSTIPDLFSATDKNYKLFGGGLNFIVKDTTISGFYRRYRNDIEGNTNQYGAQVRSLFGSTVASIRYMRVDPTEALNAPIPSYHQIYAYLTMALTEKLHGDISGLVDLYDHKVDRVNRDYAVKTGGSLSYHITEHFRVSGELSYSNDIETSDSMSGSLWLRYHI